MQNVAKLFTITSVCAFITACTVGPDFVPPITEVPSQYAINLPNKKSSKVDYSEWWQAFRDPMLNRLIATGLAKNYSLAEARAKIMTEESSVSITKAEAYPTVPAHFNITHDTQSLVALQRQNPFLIESTMLYDIGIEPSWKLDFFGGEKRALESAQAQLGSTIMDAIANQVTLAADIAKEYVQYREQQALLTGQQQLIDTDVDLVHLESVRYHAGLSDAVNLQTDQANLHQARATLKKFRYELATTLYRIDALIGELPTATINQTLQAPAPIPTVKYIPYTGLPSDLLRQRPDILLAETKVEKTNADVGVAISEYFPRFTLGNSLGQQSIKLRELFNYDANYSSLGPFIDWRILDFWRIKYDVNKNKGLKREALLDYQEVVINAFKEVDTAMVTFAKQKYRVIEERKAVSKQHSRVMLEQQRYHSGLENYLEVLRQRQQEIADIESLLENKMAYSEDYIDLSQALGGGWHANNTTAHDLPEPLTK